MGRPASGWVRWSKSDSVWVVRVTLSEGKRSEPIAMTGLNPCSIEPTDPPRGCACGPCRFARDAGSATAKEYRELGYVAGGTALTVSEWFKEYYKAAARGTVGRKNRGKPQASVEDRKARFRVWVEPIIGTMPMAVVSAADLRRIVQKLDAQVLVRARFYAEREEETEPHKGRKPGISAKTAANIWGEVTSGFKEATHSKLDELRVLEVNPSIGMLGPITADECDQAALYGAELLAVLACKDIPARRRRAIMCAAYAAPRRSEEERIEACDVDLVTT